MTFRTRLEAAERQAQAGTGPHVIIVIQDELVDDDGEADRAQGRYDTLDRALARYCRQHGLTEPPPADQLRIFRFVLDHDPPPAHPPTQDDAAWPDMPPPAR